MGEWPGLFCSYILRTLLGDLFSSTIYISVYYFVFGGKHDSCSVPGN
jgi:hypothetical protein